VADRTDPAAWAILDRRLLVDRSPYARVYDEDVQLPDGEKIANFVRVELPAFVIVFALTGDRRVPVVRQYRQAIRNYTWELPAGHIDDEEEALLGAQRELREETGIEAAEWQSLGKFVMDANRQCGWCYTYLARGAAQTSIPDSGDLGDVTVDLLPLDELRRKWLKGEFVSAPTTLCIGLALNALGT
jgi:ADP-ribose pyrophosphatase